jgi:nicotinamide phosphoribosyltransferase
VAKTLELLAGRFGFDVNSKGYKVLRNVRVIQGDGVNPESIKAMVARVVRDGFSAENIAFGMGGALLQKLDRDTLKFAMKTSAVRIGGEWVDVFKRPIGDPGKASKKGRLALVLTNGAPRTIRAEERREGEENLLGEVFVDGQLTRDERLEDIRRRSWWLNSEQLTDVAS